MASLPHACLTPRDLPPSSLPKLAKSGPCSKSSFNSLSTFCGISLPQSGSILKPRYLLYRFGSNRSFLSLGYRSFLSSSLIISGKDSCALKNRMNPYCRAGAHGTDEIAEMEKASVAEARGSPWVELPRIVNLGSDAKFSEFSMQKSLKSFSPKTRSFKSNSMRRGRDGVLEEVEEHSEEDGVPIDGSKWDRRISRFRKKAPASSSAIPKLIGEGIYGVSPVLSALTAQKREFHMLNVQEGMDLSRKSKRKDKNAIGNVMKICHESGLAIATKTKHDLNMMVDSRPHQGLILDASPLELLPVKALDPEIGSQMWVALDMILDPQNLGAIIRSAYFFGASGVVVSTKNSAPLSGVVSKASAGALELIELRTCRSMMEFLKGSSRNGWRVLGGSVLSDASPLNEVSRGVPTILVLGNEGVGLRPLVEMACDKLIRIPGKEGAVIESLNVGVAAGVLLYHLLGDDICKSSEDVL